METNGARNDATLGVARTNGMCHAKYSCAVGNRGLALPHPPLSLTLSSLQWSLELWEQSEHYIPQAASALPTLLPMRLVTISYTYSITVHKVTSCRPPAGDGARRQCGVRLVRVHHEQEQGGARADQLELLQQGQPRQPVSDDPGQEPSLVYLLVAGLQ